MVAEKHQRTYIKRKISPCVLEKKEYAKIIQEINLLYETKYKGKSFAIHRSLDYEGNYYLYYFENRGFNDYIIIDRFQD